jgi:hypothetical protein
MKAPLLVRVWEWKNEELIPIREQKTTSTVI